MIDHSLSPTLMGRIEPQPPKGIKYMLGGESWLTPEHQTPIRLHCEEWGHLGPMVLDATILPNTAGFRVRSSDFPAPEGARGYAELGGVYYWTREDTWELEKIRGEIHELPEGNECPL